MKFQEDTTEYRKEKRKGLQKTNIMDKENRQNQFYSNNTPSTRAGDVSGKRRPDTCRFRDYRKTSPIRCRTSSPKACIDGRSRTSPCGIFRSTVSSRQKASTKDQQHMVTPLKTDFSTACESDIDSMYEALADINISSSYDEGNSNDNSFDSCDVHHCTVGNSKCDRCLEHMNCRIDNPLAEMLLSVVKSPALPTPNNSPIYGVRESSNEEDDCLSIDFLEVHSSLQEDDSHTTLPTQNQLKEMSDSLSDVMNISEIASLKRPIPISPCDTHESISNKSFSNRKYSTPASYYDNIRKHHSC